VAYKLLVFLGHSENIRNAIDPMDRIGRSKLRVIYAQQNYVKFSNPNRFTQKKHTPKRCAQLRAANQLYLTSDNPVTAASYK